MANEKNDAKSVLEIKIKRVRTHIASNLKTGAGAASKCGGLTDPSLNGITCSGTLHTCSAATD
jgi:hypothetical protein